jgi:hypothetical protein
LKVEEFIREGQIDIIDYCWQHISPSKKFYERLRVLFHIPTYLFEAQPKEVASFNFTSRPMGSLNNLNKGRSTNAFIKFD